MRQGCRTPISTSWTRQFETAPCQDTASAHPLGHTRRKQPGWRHTTEGMRITQLGERTILLRRGEAWTPHRNRRPPAMRSVSEHLAAAPWRSVAMFWTGLAYLEAPRPSASFGPRAAQLRPPPLGMASGVRDPAFEHSSPGRTTGGALPAEFSRGPHAHPI